MSEEDAVKCTPENIEQFLSQSGSMRSRALQSNGIVPAVNAATVMLAMKTKCNLLSWWHRTLFRSLSHRSLAHSAFSFYTVFGRCLVWWCGVWGGSSHYKWFSWHWLLCWCEVARTIVVEWRLASTNRQKLALKILLLLLWHTRVMATPDRREAISSNGHLSNGVYWRMSFKTNKTKWHYNLCVHANERSAGLCSSLNYGCPSLWLTHDILLFFNVQHFHFFCSARSVIGRICL